MEFIKKLYIFKGEGEFYYTLRLSRLHQIFGKLPDGRVYVKESIVKYDHLCNLSQNYEIAVEKAHSYSNELSAPLILFPNREEQLKEITRIDAATRAENERVKEQADLQRELERHNSRVEIFKKRLQHAKESLESGIFPVGQYEGITLAGIPLSYKQWYVYKSGLVDVDYEETLNVNAFVAQWLVGKIEEPTVSEWIGEVGESIELSIREIETRELIGPYGISYLNKFIDEFGNSLVWFSTKNVLKGLKTAFIKGKVKAHGEYNEIKQTSLTRCKIVA